MTILKTVEGKDMAASICEALGIFALSENLALHCAPGPLTRDCPYSIKVILCWSCFSECSSQNKTRHGRMSVEAPALPPSPPCQHYPSKVCTSKHPPMTSCHNPRHSTYTSVSCHKKQYCSTAFRLFWML